MPNNEYNGIIRPTGLEGLKGLRGWNDLSQEEKFSWLDSHPHAKSYSPLKQSIAYRNNNYLEALGQPAFDSYDIETLGEMYRDKVVNDAFTNYYKDDKDFEVLNHLTTDGKQELLESGYLNEKENKEHLDKQYDEYQANMKEAAKFAPAAPGGGFHWDTKEDWERENIADRIHKTEALIAKDNKRKVADSEEDITALYNYYTDKQVAWGEADNAFKAAISNNGDLNQVIEYMASSGLVTPAQGKNLINRDTEQKVNLVGEILAKSEFNPGRIDKLFNDVALPQSIETTSEFGDVENYQMPGSRTYNSLQATDRFKDFGASDKLREYVTWQILAHKYGTQDAISNLETSMMTYAHENEGFKEWASDVYLNVVLGGVANIMNKVNAVGNMITEANYGSEGLAYKLQGKNPDGSEREQAQNGNVFNWFADNWDNPYYWSKVDEYNTLDPLEIADIDANGGTSPYTTVRPPDEVIPFFSTETLKEALKMGKFVWSDYLTGRLLGGISNGLSAGAARIGGAGLGAAVGKAAALGTVLASGMGIAESYGVMTFEQTYQQMMESLDSKRDAVAMAKVKELMQTPESQQEINKVIKRLQAENPKVSEEDIRASVESDFINYHLQQYNNSDEAITSRNQDEAIARKAAANAYIVDATIEEIRMSAANFAFRKYLFDRGTRAALGDNTNYAKTAVNASGELEVVNPKLAKAWATIKPVWGGFESNYFDDVTVGFGKGFGLAQYNAYLQSKYDPEKAGVTSDYSLSFLEGLSGGLAGAEEALGDRQSFYDGFVGALGAPMSVMLRMSSKERNEAAQRMNRENAKNLTVGEWINKHFMNPLLDAYYEEKGKQERTNEILPTVNAEIAKHKEALEDVNQLIIGLNDMAEASISGDHIQRKDAKDNQAFRLLYVMSGLNSAPLISEHPLIQNAADEIDRLAGGKVTEEEITAFLAQNKNYNDYENSREQAAKRIQKNAQSLQDMSKKITSARNTIENSVLGQGIQPALKEQLVYQLAMNDSWQERLSSIEDTLTGKEQVNTTHSAVASYGNKAEYERQVKAQQSLLLNLTAQLQRQKEYAKLVKEHYDDTTKNNKATVEEIQNAKNAVLEAQLNVQTLGETLREAKVRLKEMEKDSSVFDTEELPVLNGNQIINLNPSERSIILDKKNRNNYSEAQQVQIDDALEELKQRSPDASQLISDADRLFTRIKDNKKAYRRIQDNPDAAAAYVSTINVSRAAQLKRVYAQRRIDETYKTFDAAQNNEELLAIAKQALNSKEMGMKSYHIDEYIKKNPEKGEVLKGLSEVAKTREDAYNAINSTIEEADARKAIIEQVVNATNDSNNGAEAMSSLESLIDVQTDATAKLQFDRVLEKMKTLGYQRDATKLRNREQEREKKQEAELKRIEEEKKKLGETYGWDGYKIGDTVYNKESGNAATVVGFEGKDTMLLEIPYADGTKGIHRYHSEKSKELLSKEKPQAPNNAETVVDVTPMKGNPEEAAVEMTSVEDVNLEVDADGKVDSPTATQQAAAEQTSVQDVPLDDVSEQGNNIVEESTGVISGNRWVTVSLSALKDGVVEEVAVEDPNSVLGRLIEWAHNTKTKLQEIIDEEFGRIITDNPNTEVKFMMMKQTDSNNPLQKVLFNVIELTPGIRQKYHSEDRGGVIQANGKAWLVVGVTGFDNNASTENRKAYDTMKAPISRRRMEYFNTNPAEEYYVDSVASTKVQNTTSGRLVRQRAGEDAPRLRKISELLKSAGRALRQGEFGIQTNQEGEKSFALSKNVKDGVKVFPPRNLEDNKGRIFILVDTANGNKIPGMIEPAMYNELSDNSPLKEQINNTISQLFSTNYEVREKAIKELCGYLVLGDSKNILIGTKDANVLTIKQQGMADITQKLGAEFDIAKFMKDLEMANFQINMTLKSLNDPVMLKMYDDSNALMTNIASMRTAGMSYTLYMTDAAGKPIIHTPVGNAVPGTGRSEFKTYRSVRINNTTYEFKGGKWINRNNGETVAPGSALEKSVIYNDAIQQGHLQPFASKEGKEMYLFEDKDGRIFVVTRDNLHTIEELSQEASDAIRRELQVRIENQKRMENLEDVDFGDETPTPPKNQNETLTPEQVAQQAVGNFEEKAEPEVKPQPQKEVIKEAKETQSKPPKEVISDVGTKSLNDLQNTKKLSTFVDVATSEEFGDALYEVLEAKGWGIGEGTFADDEQILKAHKVSTTGITNVEDWMNQIRDCK